MTGFGRASFTTPRGPVRVEIKSTNLKFLELSSRVPEELAPFSESIRKIIQRRVKRGKVFLSVAAPESLIVAGELKLNERLAAQYHRAFRRLGRALGIRETIGLGQIARMPDVFTRSVSPRDVTTLWRVMRAGLERALVLFERSRRREGGALAADMRKRAARIAAHLAVIRGRIPKVIELHRKKIAARLKLQPLEENSAGRVAAENAAFSKACDVTEEMVRLASHLAAFRTALGGDEEAGRKMDFILQEMIRETNTIGAKANDFAIAARVIQIKAELERIREQAQNVE